MNMLFFKKGIIPPFLIVLSLFLTKGSFAQNVGVGTTNPGINAIMDVFSTQKGFLPPRLSTSDRLAIPTTITENGLLVYDTSDSIFYYWNGATWKGIPEQLDYDNQILSISGDTLFIENGNYIILPEDADWSFAGDDLYNLNLGKVGVGTSNPTSTLSILSDSEDSTTSSFAVISSSFDTLFLVRDDGKIGVGMGNPTTELDVMGDEKVWKITPRYTGPASFVIPGTAIPVTFDRAVSWSKNSHLYARFIVNDTITWLEAQEAARFVGGYLPTITSEAENEFIINNILPEGNTAIGYADAQEEGEFYWITGELGVVDQDTLYTDWFPGEPNNAFTCNAGEDGVAYWMTDWDPQRRWNDINLGDMLPYCPDGSLTELVIEFEYVESP
jgi:hypothetical protein